MALLSGITFDNIRCRVLAMRRILTIAQENSSDVYKTILKSDLLFTFIEMCQHFD